MKLIERQWTPSAKRPRSRIRSVIDVSGLLAIMLALLFLMMFGRMYPMHPKTLPVDMASARHSTPQPNALRDDAVTVGIARDGTLYLNSARIASADLPGLLREAMRESADKTVFVKADARAKYADVKVALDAIRAANAANITFLTERPATSAP